MKSKNFIAPTAVSKHEIKITVPSECVCQQKIPEGIISDIRREITEKFVDWFGGSEEICKRGSFRLNVNNIAYEDVNEISSACNDKQFYEHKDKVNSLACDIANRLTQNCVKCCFDKTTLFWPNGLNDSLKAGNNCVCQVGVKFTNITHPVKPIVIDQVGPIMKFLTTMDNLLLIRNISDARNMFHNILGFSRGSEILSCSDNINQFLTGSPTILAERNGFKIAYMRLSSKELRQDFELNVMQEVCKDNSFRGLFIASDKKKQEWELVNVSSRNRDSVLRIQIGAETGEEEIQAAAELLMSLDSTGSADELQERYNKTFESIATKLSKTRSNRDK